MTFDEWLEAYYSGTQIDEGTTGMVRTAFEAGKCEAGAVGLRDKVAMAATQGEGRGNSERVLKRLLNFAQDDGLAATYQTLGQYRSEIIKMIASILVEQINDQI
jgi:hypothetical protein